MNENDSVDDQLSKLLKQVPPPVPDLQRQIRRRITAKIFQRRVITAASAVVIVFALALAWQFWLAPPPVPAVAELSAAELNSLFAPPPVDPLLVLDRQQQVALHTLGRLENPR